MQTLAQSAIGLLRVIGWVILICAGIVSATYILNTFSVPDTFKGFYMLVALGSLLGGLFVWAVCIALAAVTENSIAITYMLEDAADDAQRQHKQQRERGVSQRDLDMILNREMQRPAKPNPGILLRDKAAPVVEPAAEPAHHESRVVRIPRKP